MKKYGNNAHLLTVITALIIVLLIVDLGELLGTVHDDSLRMSSLFLVVFILFLQVLFFERLKKFVDLAERYENKARLLVESFEAMDNMFHFIVDINMDYLVINTTGAEFMKYFYQKAPQVGHNVREFFSEAIVQNFASELNIAILNERNTTLEQFNMGDHNFHILSQYYALKNAKGEVYAVSVIVTDVSDDVDEHNEIIDLTFRDPLTDSYNRRKITEYYRESLQAKNIPAWLVFIDLNDFKEINDSYGHLIGDRILTTIAWILKEELPSEAIIARMGGDEFCALIPEITEAKLMEYIKRIEENAATVPRYPISLSIGCVHADKPKDYPFEHYFALADHMMYEKKKERKNETNKRDYTIYW